MLMGVSFITLFLCFGFFFGVVVMALFRKQTSCIGLDIGTSMVKCVKMIHGKNGYVLDSFAIEPIEEGAIQAGEIKNPSSLAQTAIKAVESCNPADKYVVVAIPNFSILSEVLTMELIPDKEMRDAVMREAARISPFDMSEVELDYSVLERDEENNTMKVLMVAAKQDIILAYIDFLSEAGLQPAIVDVDLFALMNIFHVNYDMEKYRSSILLNIGTENTVAAFIQDGIYHSSRDISVAGINFQKQLEYLPDMTPEKMHDVLAGRIEADLDARTVADALNVAGKEFANAVGVAVSYFQTFDNVEKIDFIVLTGGYALIPGLINILELRTGAEVTVLDPFVNVECSEELMAGHDRRMLGTTLSVAMGLATRKF